MTEEKDLVWLPKELADKVNAYKDPFSDKVVALMEKYIDDSKNEWKLNFESLEEDLLMYRGLMVKTKKAFQEAKEEQCEAAYELWEKIDAEIPRTDEKIGGLIKLFDPLEKKLDKLNNSLAKIDTYQIERFTELVTKLDSILSCKGQTNDMMVFLMENFKKGE
jgi:peptidoglycan hydrolase CwlO-like protein